MTEAYADSTSKGSAYLRAVRLCVQAEIEGATHYPGEAWGLVATHADACDLTADDIIKDARAELSDPKQQ